ncbi:MAG TPA: hypothetical protein VHQ47_13785 [Phycisphaerae bacterium]|nr:hypothetical protein [Phycisphaerae bacterium]
MPTPRKFLLPALALALLALAATLYFLLRPTPLIPSFSTPVGKYHPPLKYRIVSFHHGHADKNLILLAHNLGFNGVQFQIEGSNLQGLTDFAIRDAQEHYVDYCHSLGMSVTLWVHELSDVPGPWLPEYPGPVSESNDRLFRYLANHYEWILTRIVPNIDGLCLTVVETDVNATAAPLLKRIVSVLRQKCDQHHKSFMLRTFVWTPDQFDSVMSAIKQLPQDTLLMSKIVPQDWQMRGAYAAELGAVGGRPQIVEFDAHGEYFLRDAVANCMVDRLKQQFDYIASKGADGICVRVDRDDSSLLFTPNEVNLWALGMFASGAADSQDQVWNAWAAYHYGKTAAPAVIRALKPTGQVVAELLSIGPFTFGDTRQFPPEPAVDPFDQNWQNWRWDKSYIPDFNAAERGDPAFTDRVTVQKQSATLLAAQSLADLNAAKPHLDPTDFAILRSRLLTNQAQLAFRTPMALASLHYRAWRYGPPAGRAAAARAYNSDLRQLRAIIGTFPESGPLVSWKNRSWRVDAPGDIDRNALYKWLYDALHNPPGFGPATQSSPPAQSAPATQTSPAQPPLP